MSRSRPRKKPDATRNKITKANKAKAASATLDSEQQISHREIRDCQQPDEKGLAIRAWDMTVRLRNSWSNCIFHSDCGSQYCSHDAWKN